MTPISEQQDDQRRDDGVFHTTCWSIVVAAGRGSLSKTSAAALEKLCADYWYPVYVYVRRRVTAVEEAQDLTQAFFERLLEKKVIARADPSRGRFRAFLLTACQRFLANEWRDAQRLRRGGGRKQLNLDFADAESRCLRALNDCRTPETLFDREWALTLLNSALSGLRQKYAGRDNTVLFDELKPFLVGGEGVSMAAAAERLSMQEGAFRVAVHRLKSRYRELIRAAIAATVEHPDQIDDEIRKLFLVLAEK